ncbi:MAG: diaminopimelate decarboxylase [Clostridia bacterium]|nr:diaminopimelate decarboxylase [Clostridia bacterium]
MICDNISVKDGVLYFAGANTVELAKEYKTPLYLMDENKIRNNCRVYLNAMNKYFGANAMPLYASKAASFKKIYEIMKDEGMGIDVVSSGEIYTALKAGFNLKNAYFHSNNKTDEDINFAMENGVGYFVVDNKEELDAINQIAKERSLTQSILLRLTPGIDTHTYEAVNTGKVDSKFGTAIETGQAEKMVEYTLTLSNIKLCGFHCHIGSQVFESDTFIRGSKIMLEFIATVKAKFGFVTEQLDLGGGYGVRYLDSHPTIDIADNIRQVAECIKSTAAELNIEIPKILLEPGRSIVADAGMTLYTVGTVKEITGYKNYTSIDGGMTDNPRFALYGSPYTILPASRMNDTADFVSDVVGRCCESGDIIQKDVTLPKAKRGDILAVCTTGAYNYSMASNYNRITRPAVVMIKDTKPYVAVKRESLEYLTENDI